MTVEMVFVLRQHRGRMALIDDQDPVQELASDAAHEAFGSGIRSWRSHRRLDHLDAGRTEHRVEHSGELGVAVSDEEPETPAGLVEVHHQVTGQLGEPDTGGVCGDAENVDLTSRVLDDEEHIQPAQSDGLEMKQIAGQNRPSLGAQELRPGRTRIGVETGRLPRP
jgi:hypothetical protein